MTGDIGDSMIVRFEGKSRVEGNTEKFNRCRSRDNLTVISDVLWFELLALSPFKEHPNRFGAIYSCSNNVTPAVTSSLLQ